MKKILIVFICSVFLLSGCKKSDDRSLVYSNEIEDHYEVVEVFDEYNLVLLKKPKDDYNYFWLTLAIGDESKYYPSTTRAIAFDIGDLSVEDIDYSDYELEVKQLDNGCMIYNIRATVTGPDGFSVTNSGNSDFDNMFSYCIDGEDVFKYNE